MKITTHTFIPWSSQVKEDITTRQQPKGGFVEIPGPKSPQIRPRLFINDNKAGMAGLLANGEGKTLAILSEDTPILSKLTPVTRQVAKGKNGIWVLSDKEVTKYDEKGELIQKILAHGDAFWIAGSYVWIRNLTKGTLVAYEGETLVAEFAWGHNTRMTTDDKGHLFTLKNGKKPQLISFSPHGKSEQKEETFFQAFDILLFAAPEEGHYILLRGATVIHLKKGKPIQEYSFVNAGLDENRQPFISSRKADDVILTRREKASLILPLPEKAKEQLYFNTAVRAISKDQIILQGLDLGYQYNQKGQKQETWEIDDATYKEKIFPIAWQINEIIAGKEGKRLLISTSGPTGVAVIEVKF